MAGVGFPSPVAPCVARVVPTRKFDATGPFRTMERGHIPREPANHSYRSSGVGYFWGPSRTTT